MSYFSRITMSYSRCAGEDCRDARTSLHEPPPADQTRDPTADRRSAIEPDSGCNDARHDVAADAAPDLIAKFRKLKRCCQDQAASRPLPLWDDRLFARTDEFASTMHFDSERTVFVDRKIHLIDLQTREDGVNAIEFPRIGGVGGSQHYACFAPAISRIQCDRSDNLGTCGLSDFAKNLGKER